MKFRVSRAPSKPTDRRTWDRAINGAAFEAALRLAGGSGGVARMLGFSSGTTQYKTLQRRIQRYRNWFSPRAVSKQSIRKADQTWIADLMRKLPARGEISVRIIGEITISSEPEDRDISVAPEDVSIYENPDGNVVDPEPRDVLRDPVGFWEQADWMPAAPRIIRLDEIEISYSD